MKNIKLTFKLIPLFILLILDIILMSLISCSPSGSSKNQKDSERNVTFIYNLSSEPPTVDWTMATDNVSIDILMNIMEGLMEFDENLRPVHNLAESYTISNDGLTYQFKIKEGVKWSDGKELVAEDFKYSWLRALEPKTACKYAYFLFDIKNARQYNDGTIKNPDEVGIKLLGKYILEVTLSHPASYWLNIPTFTVTFPLRKDIFETYGNQWTEPENIVTLGPYLLQDWEHSNKVTLTMNENYHREIPFMKKVIALIIQEESTAISLFESGNLDFVRRVPALEIERFKGKPEYHSLPGLRIYYYGFNITKKPFTDKRVRQAFAHSVDRTQFPKFLKGDQIPMTSVVPKGMPGYEPDIGLGYNPEKARKLLSDAGYPNGRNFPKITAYYDAGRQDHKLVAEALQQIWKNELNISIDLQQQEWKVHLAQLERDPPALWRLGWGADYPDPDNFLNLFTSYSGNNHTKWKNQEYDRLIAEAAAEQDMEKRLVIYRQAQKLLTEVDAAIIPLFTESQNFLLHPSIKGFQPDGMNYIFVKKARRE